MVGEKETKIRIDNDEFTVKDKVTLNDVYGGEDSIGDYVNRWEMIKLYRTDGRELILMTMGDRYCNGMGCGMQYDILCIGTI